MNKLKLLQYEKIKIITKNSGLFLGRNVHNLCIIMDIRCKFLPLNKVDFSLSSAEKLVRNDCNDFLKTKRGFHYLKKLENSLMITGN